MKWVLIKIRDLSKNPKKWQFENIIFIGAWFFRHQYPKEELVKIEIESRQRKEVVL